MTPPIITKILLCPVIGQGTEADPYRPIVNAMVKRLSVVMHSLKANPQYCCCVVTGEVNEVNKLNTQLDVTLIPNSNAVQSLKNRFDQAVVDEIQGWWSTGEKIRIRPIYRRKVKRWKTLRI